MDASDLTTGWKIDCLIRKDRPFSETEFGRRIRADLEGVTLFIATAEDLLLAKLEWAQRGGSERQIADAAGLLRVRGVELDLAYLTHWVGALGLHDQWERAQRAARTLEAP